MDTVTVNSYQSNLETAIKIYTDSCISTYNQGLEQAKTLPADGDVAKWNAYNDYRRDMTLMVLDLVAIWSTYNTTQYPLPVNVQLTREIYTE
ncbi:insecticidal delta-endotoxin Cry8Ea1 family protein, partial [Bacillus cereus]